MIKLLNNAIQQLRSKIVAAEENIEYFSGPELTRENYHCGNLHLELRKLVTLANQQKEGFWCSVCGEMFKSPRLRVAHVAEDHIKC